MTLNGMIVLGSSQQAEDNFDKWAKYRTTDPREKLLLVSLITHQYEHRRLVAETVRDQSCLSQPQLKKTFRKLVGSGVVRLEHDRCLRIALP